MNVYLLLDDAHGEAHVGTYAVILGHTLQNAASAIKAEITSLASDTEAKVHN
ncbi:MAG: hypothetical protein AAB975_02680 [Patescibacteria group bacterium]